MSTKSQRRQDRLMGSTFLINDEPKELRDCTRDEIAIVLDQIAGEIEDQAAELRSAVNGGPDIEVGDILDVLVPLNGEIDDLVGVVIYRDSLR